MALGNLAGLDNIGLNDTTGLPINPATEETLSSLAASISGGSGGTIPVIYNVVMTTAGVEYSQLLPTSTKSFTVKCRGYYDVKFAFTSVQSGTTYFTIPTGQNYFEEIVKLSARTLYFQCDTAGQVLEIIAYS